MANTFASWAFSSEILSGNTRLTLSAVTDSNIEKGRVTSLVLSNDVKDEFWGIILSEKETKELISALQARIDGEINAFTGTFNQ